MNTELLTNSLRFQHVLDFCSTLGFTTNISGLITFVLAALSTFFSAISVFYSILCNRPYLAPANVRVSTSNLSPNDLKLYYELKNSGNRPAKNLITYIKIFNVDLKEKYISTIPLPAEVPGGTTIYPQIDTPWNNSNSDIDPCLITIQMKYEDVLLLMPKYEHLSILMWDGRINGKTLPVSYSEPNIHRALETIVKG